MREMIERVFTVYRPLRKVTMKNGFLFLLIAAMLQSLPALSYDQQVSASVSLEGYTVYSRNGTTLSRRRVVSNLGLGAWNLLSGETDPYYKGPRLSIDFAVRLSGDMGVSRKESTATSELNFVPGAEPLSFSLLSGYINAEGFLRDTLDFRIGRQMSLDTLGFFAFDGITAKLRLPLGISVVTYLGFEIRGGQLFGYDNFELDGTDRGDREDLTSDRYPDREKADARLSVGCELSVAPKRWIEAAAAFRAVGIIGDAGNMADERAGGRLSIHAGMFQSTAQVVYNTMINGISEGVGEIGVTPADMLGIFVEYRRSRPVFEGDSIFNVFDTTPQNDLGGRFDLRIRRFIDLSAWGFTVLANEGGGLSGDKDDAWVSGAGGGIGAKYHTTERSLSGRFSMQQEWGEQRIGAEIGGGHGFLRNNRLWLSFRLSYWHIEDDFSELYRGDTAGYVISGRFNITHQLYFLGEFEHYVGDGRPSRLTGYALLHMDLWR